MLIQLRNPKIYSFMVADGQLHIINIINSKYNIKERRWERNHFDSQVESEIDTQH